MQKVFLLVLQRLLHQKLVDLLHIIVEYLQALLYSKRVVAHLVLGSENTLLLKTVNNKHFRMHLYRTL